MKIGYLEQVGDDYEYIYPKGNKIAIMDALISYMKRKKVPFEKISFDASKKILKSYDYIFVGFNFWKLYIYPEFNRQYKKIMKSSLTTLSHPLSLVKVIENKCKIHKLFNSRKNLFPALKTSCISSSHFTKEKLNQIVGNKTFFLKPNPGLHSVNVRTYKFGNNVNNYIKTVKKKYSGIIAQRYVSNFATNKNPEYRCVVVGNTISHVVCTIMDKNSKNHSVKKVLFKSRIPKKLQIYVKRMISFLEKKFKFHNLYCRIDFGKVDDAYFLNEIEILPGIFSEYNFSVIKKIGDQIIQNALKEQRKRE